MNSEPSFEILFRKKIPYWSELLMGIMVVFFIFLFLLSFFMLPSKDISDEMKVAYYILVVPEWLKEASAYSFIGLIILIPLSGVSRTYNPAVLEIKNENITITGAKMDRVLPINSITRITLNDVNHLIRRPKEALEVIIKQKYGRTTSFLLRYYVQSEQFVEALSAFEGIDFLVHSGMFDYVTHDNEES